MYLWSTSDGLAVVLLRRVSPVVMKLPPLLGALPGPLVLLVVQLLGVVLVLVSLLLMKLSSPLVCGEDLPLLGINLILGLGRSPAAAPEEV